MTKSLKTKAAWVELRKSSKEKDFHSPETGELLLFSFSGGMFGRVGLTDGEKFPILSPCHRCAKNLSQTGNMRMTLEKSKEARQAQHQ
jgi:hypothetical protein